MRIEMKLHFEFCLFKTRIDSIRYLRRVHVLTCVSVHLIENRFANT